MSTEYPSLSLSTNDDASILRIVAFGPLNVVNDYVVTQHRLGFAEVSEWSRPLPSSNPGEVMRILTKRSSLSRNG
ncbi:MAG: hypothetical protein AAFU78_16950 [Cyanobacteria bacterium J06633_2]